VNFGNTNITKACGFYFGKQKKAHIDEKTAPKIALV